MQRVVFLAVAVVLLAMGAYLLLPRGQDRKSVV